MGKNNNDEQYSFNSEEMTVTLNLEEGPVECAIIVILTVEDNDYMALMPLDDDGENEEGEVWFYRYFEDETDVEADPVLEYIDSDEEFEAVSAAFEEFLDNSEYDELMDDES